MVPGSYAGPASYAGVVRQVLPSVVLIRTADGLGSGVVLDSKGNIVTNAHVAGNAKEFQIQVAGDTSPRSAKLVGTYAPDDLAVIRADNPAGLQPATFGDSDQAQAGDVVLAIGNPTLAAGSPQGGGQAQGIGFAIPSNLARDVATQIIETGHVTNSHRAAIGAEVSTVLGPDGAAGQGAGVGVGVVTVTDGGPAYRAGLRAGDVITKAGSRETTDTRALSQALAAASPGDKITVTVSRDGEDRTVQITLSELPVS
jgi:putative serine protease PepD